MRSSDDTLERYAMSIRRSADPVSVDANPPNVLVARDGEGWRVLAVLDWEFAFSGSPIFDAASVVRGRHEQRAFVGAFADGHGALPAGRQHTAVAADELQMWELMIRPLRMLLGSADSAP